MAIRPEMARSFAALHDAIMAPGELEQRVKALAYLAVSVINEAPYCAKRADMLARRIGCSDEMIWAVRHETEHTFTPMEKVCLHIARELTRTSTIDDIGENELTLLSQAQLVEIVSVVSLANFDNRFCNATDGEETPHR